MDVRTGEKKMSEVKMTESLVRVQMEKLSKSVVDLCEAVRDHEVKIEISLTNHLGNAIAERIDPKEEKKDESQIVAWITHQTDEIQNATRDLRDLTDRTQL